MPSSLNFRTSCIERRNATLRIWHNLIRLNFFFDAICAIFPGSPVQNHWRPRLQGGRCLDAKALNRVDAPSLNSASNISILVVPQQVISNLQWCFEANAWRFCNIFSREFGKLDACPEGNSGDAVADEFSRARFSFIGRLYYSVCLFGSQDATYYACPMSLWTSPEMISKLLAIQVCPGFSQSSKLFRSFI